MKEKNAKKKDEPKKKKREFPFFNFLIQKSQALDFAIILGCCLIAYFGIRYCYPYPLTCADSGGYVDAAIQNMFYIYRPFGYSYFLILLHSITTNIHSIFIVQTFLLFLATSFLAVTVKYFYPPIKKWVWYISLAFLIFTPTSFIMANWIMSDLLFSVQIYFVVSLFIFIIKRESWVAAFLYILLIFTALHVRYSAVVFPFALLPFFLMKKGKIRWVITLLSVLAFSVFYFQIKKSMKERVKIDQFSTGFDGWVFVNNVSYALPYIDLQPEDLKNRKLKEFHNFIMDEIDIRKSTSNSSQGIDANFMWDKKMPMKQYLFKKIQEQNTQYLPTFVKLGSTSYKDYAIHVITHYPFSYFRYYYLPNCKQAFYPPAVCIAQPFPKDKVIYDYYNIDKENKMQAKHNVCSDPKYDSAMKKLHLIMWLTIVSIGVAAFLKRKKIYFSSADKIVFWGVFSFAAIYYASSIFAAPMEIRYVMGMHSIQFVFCYILLCKLFDPTEKQSQTKPEKKDLIKFKKRKFYYLTAISLVVVTICFYFLYKNFKVTNRLQTTQSKTWEDMNDPKMIDYIEACKFCNDNLPDSILVVTRKPVIFSEYSVKKSISFPWNAEPDSIMSYLRNNGATHVILDERYHYSYFTLFPAVQKYPEKFKVIHVIGITDTVSKRKPTYVLEYNDLWGYFGERVDGKKTGEGYEVFQDGRKFVGEFENNLPNGFGTLYDPHGKVIVKGRWQNGAFVGN